jgi:putative aminopeptidase FrvX
MTREIRFSTSNLSYSSPNEDCFLDPNDPIHALKGQGTLGTLTPASVTAAYDAHKRQQIADQHFQLRDEAKQLGIRPGTPAWFALNQTRSR